MIKGLFSIIKFHWYMFSYAVYSVAANTEYDLQNNPKHGVIPNVYLNRYFLVMVFIDAIFQA